MLSHGGVLSRHDGQQHERIADLRALGFPRRPTIELLDGGLIGVIARSRIAVLRRYGTPVALATFKARGRHFSSPATAAWSRIEQGGSRLHGHRREYRQPLDRPRDRLRAPTRPSTRRTSPFVPAARRLRPRGQASPVDLLPRFRRSAARSRRSRWSSQLSTGSAWCFAHLSGSDHRPPDLEPSEDSVLQCGHDAGSLCGDGDDADASPMRPAS
jgi:hypothetical protein